MKRWPEGIALLPPRTRSILRSTVILASLVQVVSELIQNSLDANARSIQVGIDCDEWSCWVQDDGTGFTIDNLESLANDCKTDSMRYSTSKVPGGNHASFGFRGEGEPRSDRVEPGAEPWLRHSSVSIDRRLEHSRNIIQNGKGQAVMVRDIEGTDKRHGPPPQAHTQRLGDGCFILRTFGTLAKTIGRHHRLRQRRISQRRSDLLIFVDSAYIGRRILATRAALGTHAVCSHTGAD